MLRGYWLSLLQHGNVVKIKKIEGADCFRSPKVGPPSFHVLRYQGTEVSLRKQCDGFRSKHTCLERVPSASRPQRASIDETPEEDQKSGGNAQSVAGEISLRDYFGQQRDDNGREEEGTGARQDRLGQQGQKHVGGNITPKIVANVKWESARSAEAVWLRQYSHRLLPPQVATG